jgi:hypothetical protein
MSHTAQQFQSNQFANNAPIKGDSARTVNFNVLPVMMDPNSTNTIYPGDAVVLTTTSGSQIFVDKSTASEVPFGFYLLDEKKAAKTANMSLEIAMFGEMIWAEASGSIDRGDNLEFVPDSSENSGVPTDGPLMKLNAGVNPISGVAVDEASDGQLFRMIITQTQSTFIPTVVGGSINNCPIGASTPNTGKFTSIATVVTALTPSATVSVDPTLGGVFTLVPNATANINAASVINGQVIKLVITTSGTAAYTLTFNTNFKSTGTLSTGSLNGKVFTIEFIGAGGVYNEVCRTSAM